LQFIDKQNLETIAQRVTLIRILVEDLPQLINQCLFTYKVHQNTTVIMSVVLTLIFSGKSVYSVYKNWGNVKGTVPVHYSSAPPGDPSCSVE